MSQMPTRMAADGGFLPSDVQAERCILGAVLIRPDVAGWLELDARAFYDPKNRYVWDAMRAVAATGRPIDEVTLQSELWSRGRLDAIGGLAYLGELANAVATAANVEAYAEIVRTHWVTRQVLEVAGRARGLVLAGGYEGDELRDELCGELQRITGGKSDKVHTLAEAELEVQRTIVEPTEGDELELLDTGIPGIEVPRGVTTIVGARPSGGKTALILQALVGLVRATGDHAVMCLGEDKYRTLGRRTLADATGIDGARLRRRSDLDMFEIGQVQAYVPEEIKSRIHIVHVHGQTMGTALRVVKALAHQHKLVAFAHDYVQRSRPEPDTRGQKRHDQIRVSADMFDVLAADLGCVALLGSQLNRDHERERRAPEGRDLKDCGALEEIAKMTFLLQVLKGPRGELLDELLVHVSKNSEGAAGGVFPLGFDRAHQRFYEVEESNHGLHDEGD